MPFQRIERAIDVCSAHLGSMEDNVEKAEIESYLVAALLVMAVSNYEERVEEAFAERLDRCGDVRVRSLASKLVRQRLRTPLTSNIGEVLVGFGTDCKVAFRAGLTPEAETAWNNFVTNRQTVGHTMQPPAMTLLEMKEKYPGTIEVLNALRAALQL